MFPMRTGYVKGVSFVSCRRSNFLQRGVRLPLTCADLEFSLNPGSPVVHMLQEYWGGVFGVSALGHHPFPVMGHAVPVRPVMSLPL